MRDGAIVFVGDETDDADLGAVFEHLAALGASGERCHPSALAFDMDAAGVCAFHGGAPFRPGVVVGWVFEEWLVPGMAVLEMLARAGHHVINSGSVLFGGQNKAVMSARLHAAGVPHERVGVGWTTSPAPDLEYPVVVKPGLVVSGGITVRSSGGGVVRARDRDELAALAGVAANLRQPLYFQRYVPKRDGRDIRVWVFGYQAAAACTKVPPPGEWVTHAGGGTRLVHCDLSPSLTGVAEAAARAVEAPIAGVDIAETGSGFTVLEVNTCPTFLAARPLLGEAVPQALARFLVAEARRVAEAVV